MSLRFKSAVAFFFLFFLHGFSIGTRKQGISYNGYGFMSVLFLPNSKNRKLKNKIALKPMLAEVDFHYTQIEARNLFFLKLFREDFLFFLFNYQHFTIMCIKKALKVLQNRKTVVSLSHQTKTK